ncbi:hypothetical protein ABZS83_36385, partial [Streptomyces sp. NPDC005426]|uniref:hypothetical protein n=1 Tax=Streptomyces sp. NPDC005426 TaxID=3155344 RepID=UPI0033B990AB
PGIVARATGAAQPSEQEDDMPTPLEIWNYRNTYRTAATVMRMLRQHDEQTTNWASAGGTRETVPCARSREWDGLI